VVRGRSTTGISGTRVQKVALIPGTAGRYRVPEIKLSWWNLGTGKMEIATIPSREIFVNAAAEVSRVESSVAEPQTPLQTSAPDSTNTFWLWLSLALASGWILNALYWWTKIRNPCAATTPAVAESPQLRQASKRLRQACHDSDAIAARLALLTWGQAWLTPRQIHNLHQLGNALGADLRHEIELLNQSLYAPGAAQWQGEPLWLLCQRLEKESPTPSDQANGRLLPLNPAP
jgi:hypothetical protein